MTDLALKHIRQQADGLGVTYHHKAGIAKIQAAIEAHLDEAQHGSDPVEPVKEQPVPLVTSVVTELSEKQQRLLDTPVVPMSEKQYRLNARIENKRKVSSLIHCKVVCMNPNKREWAGEILSVGSAKLGTWKRYVPFNTEWHVPKILFDMMKEKKCTIFQAGKNERGHPTKKSVLINEYNIEVLDPLTKEELEKLRIKQAMAKGKSGD